MDPSLDLAELERKLKKIVEKYFALRAKGARAISFPSGKGGVGKTAVVMNLATALALKGKRVAVVDLNLALPNVHVFLGEDFERSVTHFLAGEDEIEEIVTKFRVKKAEIDVFPAKSLVDYGRRVKIERVDELILKLKPRYEYILFDQSPGLSKFAIYPTLVSDVVFVVSADIKPAYIDAVKVKEILTSSGVNFGGFIVNMAKKGNLKYFYNEKVYATIPYDWRLKNAFLNGKTVFQIRFSFLSSSKRAFTKLASRIISDYPPEAE